MGLLVPGSEALQENSRAYVPLIQNLQVTRDYTKIFKFFDTYFQEIAYLAVKVVICTLH